VSARGPVTVKAHAKINVFLRVLGRRPDGFHDLETLLVPLDLHDVVTAAPGEGGLALAVSGPLGAQIPPGEENLVMVAARALAEAAGLRAPSAYLTIDKRVPVAAGMGGGSADAAAALRALDRLWGTALEPTALDEVAARVGSDVPALLASGAVFAAGRGERVHRVHVQTTSWVAKPLGFAVRTPDAFAWWDAEGATGPDAGALIAAAETGNDELLGHALFNDLQAPVVAHHPEIAETIETFIDAGALGAVMTGSGPTVVALATHLGHADRLAEAVPGSFVASGPPVAAPQPRADAG
jgi:4-diphosphocytidyl-2-C-methyl-D-erythritol kinase